MEETEGEGAPSCLLWIGNVAADASEALLIQTFAKYGAVDYVSAYPARSYAFIEFRDLEDAKVAKSGLQGKLVKGQPLRIEFAKPAKPSKQIWIWGVGETVTKEQLEAEFKKFGRLDDFRLLRDRNSAFAEFGRLEDASAAVKGLNKKIIQGEELRVDFLRSHSGKRGHGAVDATSHTAPEERASKEGEPSETLWIGFPPPSRVDEDGLRKSFILFGEVERITTFPDRSYCFVQFRNVDEATRAKEGLQGRLLNDPRILIKFSSTDTSKRTVRAEGLYNLPQNVEMGGPRSFGTFDWPGAMHPSSRFPISHHDFSRATKGFARPGDISAGILAAPPIRGRLPNASEFFDSWLRPDEALIRPLHEHPGAAERDFAQREHKRTNFGVSGYLEGYMEGGSDFDAQYFEGHAKPWVVSSNELRQSDFLPYSGVYSGFEKGNASDTFMAKLGTPDHGAPWRGSIAKAGNFVCHVGSFPVGRGINDSLPGVVNCVARTSLDTLAQHFYQAVEYGVIYFMPDGDRENASFQEFVSYLGDKQRAGVAHTHDGTTLFLVPPSDFAKNALKLHGECLFGLVIKFHQAEQTPSRYHHQQAGLLPLQGPQEPRPRPDLKEELTRSTSTTAVMFPESQLAGSHSSWDAAYSSASLLGAPSLRPHDDVEANGGAIAFNAEIVEDATRENEIKVKEQALASLQPVSNDSMTALQSLLRQSGVVDESDSISSISIADALKTEGEANNCFQATLKLAAALLQRMHNDKGSASPTS